MARRNRYREFESMMAKIMVGDAVAFALYMLFASKGWTVVSVIATVLIFVVSILALVWLFFTKELYRRRSLWMVTGFASICLCLLFSLILKYPCPPVVAG